MFYAHRSSRFSRFFQLEIRFGWKHSQRKTPNKSCPKETAAASFAVWKLQWLESMNSNSNGFREWFLSNQLHQLHLAMTGCPNLLEGNLNTLGTKVLFPTGHPVRQSPKQTPTPNPPIYGQESGLIKAREGSPVAWGVCSSCGVLIHNLGLLKFRNLRVFGVLIWG